MMITISLVHYLLVLNSILGVFITNNPDKQQGVSEMKEITSYQIDLLNELDTKDITDLYHYVSSSNYDVYLYQKGHIADAENFPKMISFFLLTKKQEPLVVIIDGEKPEEAFQYIKLLLNQHVKRTVVRKRHLSTDDTSSVVI